MVSSSLKYRVKTERQRAATRSNTRKELERKAVEAKRKDAEREKKRTAHQINSGTVCKKKKKDAASGGWVVAGKHGKKLTGKQARDFKRSLSEAAGDAPHKPTKVKATKMQMDQQVPPAPAANAPLDLAALGTAAAMMDAGGEAEEQKDNLPGWGFFD